MSEITVTRKAVPDGNWRPNRDTAQVLHPLVRYMLGRLETMLGLIELEQGGIPVHIDSVRVRDLNAWVVEAQGTLFDNLGSMSGYCNARCNFCYEFGNSLPFDLTMLTVQEARTRARYYDGLARRGLLAFNQRLDLEPFTNPNLLKILRIFREHDPASFIRLTTNGAALDDETLEALAGLAPVHLVVSLNTADERARRALMHDKSAARAIEAVAKMRGYGIPYVGSIVAWPQIPEDELRETIRYLDSCHARAVRVSLPSYSGVFSDEQVLFNTYDVWTRLFDVVEEEADRARAPVTPSPYLFKGRPAVPVICGIIPSSPAAAAGVRRGDVILEIARRPVSSRAVAKRMIAECAVRHEGALRLQLKVRRDGHELSFDLVDASGRGDDLYPYKPVGYEPPAADGEGPGMSFGLYLNDDLDPADLARAVGVVRNRGAHDVVLMTSALVEGFVAAVLEGNAWFRAALRDVKVQVVSPEHRYWRGNIVVGDLYQCSDFIRSLQDIILSTGDGPTSH